MTVIKANGFIIIIMVNVMLLGAGVFILELIFGNWFKQDNLYKLNVIRDRTVKYEIRGLYESHLETATYRRDQYGLRGQFEDPSEITILTVGGSTTDQRYIADGQTWQDVLQQEFEVSGRKIAVANAGVDGQSTLGHIKNFDWWFPNIPNLDPKFVLFYIGLNDFYRDGGNGKYTLTTEQAGRSLRELLREKSAVYHIYRTLHGAYLAGIKEGIGHRSVSFKKLEWVSKPIQTSYDELMEARLMEYAERLEALILRTRGFGSIPIFVTQPSRKYRFTRGQLEGVSEEFLYDGVAVNGVDYYIMMRKLDEVTMSVSLKHDILCVNLAGEKFWEDADFYDYSHMTPIGARKVGKYLFDSLKGVI